jgi:hypothetical protein
MKRRTESEWQTLIEEWKESGENQKIWCENKGISIRTFQSKKSELKLKEDKTLRKPENNTQDIKWLPVENRYVDNQERNDKNKSKEDNKIEISKCGFKISLGPNFDDRTLTSVCKVLMRL